MTSVDPGEVAKLPLCADARASFGGAKPDAEKLLRYARERTAKFVATASKLLDATRGQRMRCDAARVGLVPADPACRASP